MNQLYVTDEEATVLAKALALSVDPQSDPQDATDASLVVWAYMTTGQAWDPMLGSLATMLAEAVTHG